MKSEITGLIEVIFCEFSALLRHKRGQNCIILFHVTDSSQFQTGMLSPGTKRRNDGLCLVLQVRISISLLLQVGNGFFRCLEMLAL